jgi:hypothetical protein
VGVEFGIVEGGGGGGVWSVFGGKTAMACKSAFFNILDLVR